VLDGIGKDISLNLLAILLRILLRTEYDGLASMHSVNPVYHLVEMLHLLELLDAASQHEQDSVRAAWPWWSC